MEAMGGEGRCVPLGKEVQISEMFCWFCSTKIVPYITLCEPQGQVNNPRKQR